MISDKTIKTITDADLGLSSKSPCTGKSTRTGARAILFDRSGRVALVYEHMYDHYKLPGGCVEAGEDIEQALRREVKEEVGARVKNLRYLGVVRSHLSRYNEACNQHYFTAEVDGELGESAWIDEEELHGCSIVWCRDLAGATEKVKGASSQEYVHLFERARELAGLAAAEL